MRSYRPMFNALGHRRDSVHPLEESRHTCTWCLKTMPWVTFTQYNHHHTGYICATCLRTKREAQKREQRWSAKEKGT